MHGFMIHLNFVSENMVAQYRLNMKTYDSVQVLCLFVHNNLYGHCILIYVKIMQKILLMLSKEVGSHA
jgi:hypothetical protein